MDDEKIEELKAMPLRDRCYAQAKAMGWYINPSTGEPKTNTVERSLLLIDGELSEAHEGLRKDAMDKHLQQRRSVDVELADAWIRCMDTLGSFGCDVSALKDAGGIDDVTDYDIEMWIHRAKCDLWSCSARVFRPASDAIDSTRVTIEHAAECCGISLMEIVREKLDYNLTRADHQLANRAKDGGKKF